MGQSGLRGTRASDHLDLIRGLAALAVVYSHARVLLIRSVGDDIRPVDRMLYLLSGYGHSAVMVFFVLSGYLVGGSVVRATASGRWSWGDYLLARGVRLYVVLVPALLLTALWDRIGLEVLSGRPGNDDTARAIVNEAAIVAHSGPIPFLGNLAFLQTISVPSYGSNVALWSLANEAWYYLIFPCLWLAGIRGQAVLGRVAYVALGLAMLFLVGPKIAGLFPTWLLGVGLALSPRLRPMQSRWSGVVAALPFLGVLGLIGLNRIPGGAAANYAVALSFSLFLMAILHRREPGGSGPYARSASALAGCSYTLYLTHLPPLICLRACWTYERPWPPDAAHWGMVGFACLGCLAYAFGLSALAEARTDRVRGWLAGRPGRRDQPASRRSSIRGGGTAGVDAMANPSGLAPATAPGGATVAPPGDATGPLVDS